MAAAVETFTESYMRLNRQSISLQTENANDQAIATGLSVTGLLVQDSCTCSIIPVAISEGV